MKYNLTKKAYLLFNRKTGEPSVSITGTYMMTTHKMPCSDKEHISKEVIIKIK